MRSALRKVLIESWRHVIENDYVRQRVNSERSLQAALWAQLNERLPDKTRRLFVAPAFTLGFSAPKKTVYPDLVVCNTRQVIGVIELKYEPRKSPSTVKDLGTLSQIAGRRGELHVSNQRYLGGSDTPTVYTFSERVLFVWAGVYRAARNTEIKPAEVHEPDGLRGSFLSLHAVTQRGEDPQVIVV